MEVFSLFFKAHLVPIYFTYGLAFFITGVVVGLEATRSSVRSLARALPFLAVFGVIHGTHEWVEMLYLMTDGAVGSLPHLARIVVLALSFFFLVEFGLRLLSANGWNHAPLARGILLLIFAAGMVWVWWWWWPSPDQWVAAADTWCRYCLAVPGAVLAAVGLCRESRELTSEQRGPSRDLRVVGLAFLLYGLPGQVFVGPSPLPPSDVVNSVLFLNVCHFPVQFWRTVMASLVAIFTVRALRVFERERQRRIEELNQARLEAQQRLAKEIAEREALRRELLRQAVWAQEEERRHIARELHDEAGQALTALHWELTALEEALPAHHPHDEIRERIEALRQLTERVMEDLRQLTTRLRPAVLDELGLVAALISYADECSARYPFTVDVEVTGPRRRLPSEIETTLYRIAQEALTNVAKHARASRAHIHLHFGDSEVRLTVSDDGVGMDVEQAQRAAACGKGWGLAGICERVQLVGGQLDLRSSPGSGTDLTVQVPIPPTTGKESHESDPTAAGG
jgi:signal transduction histidine kinase